MNNKYLPAVPVLAMLTAIFLVGCAHTPSRNTEAFSNWPAGKSPQEVGYKVATNMLPRWIVTKPYVHYAEDSAWVHGLQFAQLTGDAALKEELIRRFNIFLAPGGTNLISMERHVDHNIFGIVPLELYLQTKDQKVFEDRPDAGKPASGNNR